MSIHHKSKFIIPHPYFINSSQLMNSSSVTFFGIQVESRLTFNFYINNILTKATPRAGVFFHGCSSRHAALVRKVFVTYIHPTHEFHSSFWNPIKKIPTR